MNISQKLAEEFNLKQQYADNIIALLEEGNTIPFIARYRKEMHGACDDQVIREFSDRLTYLNNLQKRKEEIQTSIEGQGKWTEELSAALSAAETMTEAEDIYRPYKQKKKTRASVAIEAGLEPLADIIWNQQLQECDIVALSSKYINSGKNILTAKDALQGASDIISERISDDAELRKLIRQLLLEQSNITCKLDETAEKEKCAVYETYKNYSEQIKTIPSHRILAINRGEKENCLKVSLDALSDKANEIIKSHLLKVSAFSDIISDAITDSYTRLLFPSLEREVRNDLTDRANEQAIKMFESNLKPLLMQPPLKDKVIMGLDPGYRTGCKVAVIDAAGNVLDHDVIYPTHSNREQQSKDTVTRLVLKHKVDVISIGNGTASKETEIFVCDLIKELPRKVEYIITNEAGASVYSASKQGAEEFPEYDLTIRSAISIARRLQDPLAELIKIDVKSIGVGQYQHDMPQKRLTEVLEGVVEDCVNSVGVDLNTASYSLLSYVAGLNTSIAKNIVEYRKKKPFVNRKQLLEVTKLGPKAYQQCAGFLRISDGENVLDNTAVHPESYEPCVKLLKKFGYSDLDVKENKLHLQKDVTQFGAEKIASEIGVGVPTLTDMIAEISKPGRDIRDSLPKPILRAEIMELKDLKTGMELTGTVRNVIDFGAFVDIGVHQDGLVHLSEMSNNYIKHPSEVLKVGDTVTVRVIGVDVDKNRIALSMRDPNAAKQHDKRDEKHEQNKQKRLDERRQKQERKQKETERYNKSLEALLNKFNKR
ncbi:MAG: RNA-binding transcriptional accessory protein [Corallococcus sp.]|nr:RNA-binding transcriptional accessory protein [Corallococcus sp.]